MRPSDLFALGVTVGTLLLVGGLLVYLLVAQTRGRGHGWLSWLLLVAVSRNPVYPVIVLALLPNNRRSRLRDQFAAELADKLAAAVPPAAAATVAFPRQSVGDLPTSG